MELDPHTCPTCGQPAKLRYQTVMLDGIRTPVEPFLACDLGHEALVRGPDRLPGGSDVRQASDDPELIG